MFLSLFAGEPQKASCENTFKSMEIEEGRIVLNDFHFLCFPHYLFLFCVFPSLLCFFSIISPSFANFLYSLFCSLVLFSCFSSSYQVAALELLTECILIVRTLSPPGTGVCNYLSDIAQQENNSHIMFYPSDMLRSLACVAKA